MPQCGTSELRRSARSGTPRGTTPRGRGSAGREVPDVGDVGDVLVRGGTIIDGTGGPPRPGDVRVRGGVIVEIGEGLEPDGEEEIDAAGAFVTPGLIDSHT